MIHSSNNEEALACSNLCRLACCRLIISKEENRGRIYSTSRWWGLCICNRHLVFNPIPYVLYAHAHPISEVAEGFFRSHATFYSSQNKDDIYDYAES